MATRTYGLTDPQKSMARAEIESMRARRLGAMGADAAEYDQVRTELYAYWDNLRKETSSNQDLRDAWREARRDPKFRELQKRMGELDRKYPLDWEGATERIESQLPPEQAEKGRARREEREARRERMRESRQGRGARRASPPPTPEAGSAPSRPRPDASDPRPPFPATPVPPPGRAEATPRAVTPPAAGKRAMHPWEAFVERFVAEHEFSAAQTNSAKSILQRQLDQARRTQQANAERLVAAQRLADEAERTRALKELNDPIDRLFEELRSRLDSLLTAEQRAKSKPATPPAVPPQPAGAERPAPPPS